MAKVTNPDDEDDDTSLEAVAAGVEATVPESAAVMAATELNGPGDKKEMNEDDWDDADADGVEMNDDADDDESVSISGPLPPAIT